MTDEPMTELTARIHQDGTASVSVTARGEETFIWRGSVADFNGVAQQAVSSQVETYTQFVQQQQQQQQKQQQQQQQEQAQQHQQTDSKQRQESGRDEEQVADISPPTARPE